MEAHEGDTVTLRCNATRTIDIIQFVWEMPIKDYRIGQNITINDLTKADSGQYTCLTQHPSGSKRPVNVICLNVYGKIIFANKMHY
ncbi:hypothetical protein DPMN_193907 [Dreissena polymorpha]|uniref:Ig-like domain-containing protein n=1 Tax=Dreissena polymorpha TaxID=45954 RepID=A0A9D3Y571_DREPO|nr:hypothetical protein DPMN_193907 [Dreissena polymorpha]